MRVCRHYRIPHSQFLGRVVGPGEPLWLESDQDKAVQYEQWLIEQVEAMCPNCHTSQDDWTDPATGRPVPDPPWETAVLECPGCRRLAAREEKLREDGDTAGRRVILRPAGTGASKAAERAARTVAP